MTRRSASPDGVGIGTGTARLNWHVIVRDARPGELADVGTLRVSAYRASGFLPPGSPYADTLRRLGSAGDGEVLVADDGTRIVGTVMLVPTGGGNELARSAGEAEIRAFAVAPEARGNGTGRLLLRTVISRATRGGVRRLLLATQPAMTAARHLYESEGFRRTPHRDWRPVPEVLLLTYELCL